MAIDVSRQELLGALLAKPPIVIDGDGGPLIFGTVMEAEGYLEPIDVVNNEYWAAYDSEGRLLRLIPGRRTVSIEPADATPSHAADLRELLRDLLGRYGWTRDRLSRASLTELVDAAYDYARVEGHGPVELIRDLLSEVVGLLRRLSW